MENIVRNLIEEAKKHGITLSIEKELHPNRLTSIWYGGTIAVAVKNGVKIAISAYGDVEAYLVKKGYIIAEVRDRCNMAEFYGAMSPYISSDKEFYDLVVEEGREEEVYNGLVMTSNNWFEFEKITNSPMPAGIVCDENKITDLLTVSSLEEMFDLVEEE